MAARKKTLFRGHGLEEALAAQGVEGKDHRVWMEGFWYDGSYYPQGVWFFQKGSGSRVGPFPTSLVAEKYLRSSPAAADTYLRRAGVLKDNPKKVWQQQPPQSRLLARHGKLYIVNEYAKDAPGEIEALWYPTGARVHYNFDEFPDEGYPARSLRDGNYSVKTGLGFSGEMRVQLERGGQTTPDFVEARQVEPPKVRPGVELSWDSVRGLWMKASKSTKWQKVVANPLPGSPWLWVAGAVAAVGAGWWLWSRQKWTCAAGHECTKLKDGSWHDDDPVTRVLKFYSGPPTNASALVVKRESPAGDYTVYELPAKTLSSQPHPVQSFLP